MTTAARAEASVPVSISCPVGYARSDFISPRSRLTTSTLRSYRDDAQSDHATLLSNNIDAVENGARNRLSLSIELGAAWVKEPIGDVLGNE
jgi:hypothetical protein